MTSRKNLKLIELTPYLKTKLGKSIQFELSSTGVQWVSPLMSEYQAGILLDDMFDRLKNHTIKKKEEENFGSN